jgi:probable HAF family extracellular repeat protein
LVAAAVYYSETQNQQRILLGTLGGDTSIALSINDAGVVVGEASTTAAIIKLKWGWTYRMRHAFIWTREKGMEDLGTLGGEESSALAINNSGMVVGVADTKNGGSHAFLWTRERGMEDLGTLGGDYSSAIAINSSGLVAGTADTKNGESHAFIWSREKGMEDLGTLGGGTCRAWGIDEAGQVFRISNDMEGWHTFVWRPNKCREEIPMENFKCKFANSTINRAGHKVGSIKIPAPWWMRAWNAMGEKLGLPQKYLFWAGDSSRQEAVLWLARVPPPESDTESQDWRSLFQ